MLLNSDSEGQACEECDSKILASHGESPFMRSNKSWTTCVTNKGRPDVCVSHEALQLMQLGKPLGTSSLEDRKELAKLDADFITEDKALCDPGVPRPTQEMRWKTERNLGSDVLGFVRLWLSGSCIQACCVECPAVSCMLKSKVLPADASVP
jgi:hypothetical protein